MPAYKKRLKDILLLLISFVTVVSFALSGTTYYMGKKITNPLRVDIEELPSEYGMAYEDVSFSNTTDGINLNGWWIPSKRTKVVGERKAIIFAHSYGDNREKMPIKTLHLAMRLSDEGYHILMFDFRNSGTSEDSLTTIGRKEKTDLLSAIQFVSTEKNISDIGLIGWSMGAATSIMAGSEAPEVKAVIADSSFADLESYSRDTFQYWTGLPKFAASVFAKSAKVFAPELMISEVKPYVAAQNLGNTGLLLIHSRKDGAIDYRQSEIIYQHAQAKEVDLWLTNKGGHIRNYKHHKEEYEKRVLEFLERNMENPKKMTLAVHSFHTDSLSLPLEISGTSG